MLAAAWCCRQRYPAACSSNGFGRKTGLRCARSTLVAHTFTRPLMRAPACEAMSSSEILSACWPRARIGFRSTIWQLQINECVAGCDCRIPGHSTKSDRRIRSCPHQENCDGEVFSVSSTGAVLRPYRPDRAPNQGRARSAVVIARHPALRHRCDDGTSRRAWPRNCGGGIAPAHIREYRAIGQRPVGQPGINSSLVQSHVHVQLGLELGSGVDRHRL